MVEKLFRDVAGDVYPLRQGPAAFPLGRTHHPEKGVVFVSMPYGIKHLDGPGTGTCDFDKVFSILEGILRAAGMQPERLDGLYGSTAMIELIWQSIQRAEIVLVDLTTKSHNVAFELGIALVLGKKIIMITQDLSHVPADYRGHRVLTYSLLWEAVEGLKSSLTDQVAALLEMPSTEQTLNPLPGVGHVVNAPGTVIKVEREYVIVKTDDQERPPAVLSNLEVEYARKIPDMARRFSVDDLVKGAFIVDTIKGAVKYSLVAGQQDPWPTLEKRFPVGTVFAGHVQKVLSGLGVFVEVHNGVNGLVPERTLAGNIPQRGCEVEVKVTKMDAADRQIGLRLNKIVSVVPDVPVDDSVRRLLGQRGYGKVVRACPQRDGRGGFVLLTVEGRDRPAMLLCKYMTDSLRADLANGHVDVGEEIYVEVVEVSPAGDRVLLRELPDPEEGGAGADDEEPAA